MHYDRLVDLLLESATLKRMPRTGWGMRGVAPVESVAEHSFGVGLVALALADVLSEAGEAALSLESVERQHILRILDFFDGNRQKTADALGISRKTLYRKLSQYSIT